MYGCKIWTIKKAEHWRIDAFELQCWRRFLRVSWTAIKQVNTRGNQAWIFTGRTDAEAETPVLWPSDAKSQLIREDPDAGKDWRQEEKGTTEDQMVLWHHRLTQWTWVWGDSGSWWWTWRPGMLQFMGWQRVGHDWSTFTSITLKHWCRPKGLGLWERDSRT